MAIAGASLSRPGREMVVWIVFGSLSSPPVSDRVLMESMSTGSIGSSRSTEGTGFARAKRAADLIFDVHDLPPFRAAGG